MKDDESVHVSFRQHRWLTACLTTICIGASPAVSAAAAHSGSMLQVAGTRTAFTDLQLAHGLTWPLSTRVRAAGRYAGLLVQRADNTSPVELFMYARDLNFGERAQMLPIVYHRRLAPGLYRFTLITDAAANLTFPVASRVGITLHPTTPVDADVRIRDAAVGGAVPVGIASVPVGIQSADMTVLIGAEEASASQASFVDVCLTRGSACEPKAIDPFVTPGCTPDCETGVEQQLVYPAGSLGGRYVARLVAAAAGVQRLAGLLVLTLPQRFRQR